MGVQRAATTVASRNRIEDRSQMGVPDERMTEESYATLSWNQPLVKFNAERRFRGRCIGSKEGVFWF